MGRIGAVLAPRTYRPVARANIGRDWTPRGTQCTNQKKLEKEKMKRELLDLLKREKEDHGWLCDDGARRRLKKLRAIFNVKK